MRYVVTALALFLAAAATAPAQADEIVMVKGLVKGGDVGVFTQTDIQDTELEFAYQPGYVIGDPLVNAKGAPTTIINGNSGGGSSVAAGPEYGFLGIGLYRFDLASIIPGVDASRIVSVQLNLYQGGPTGGEQEAIYRVTTPWSDENTVTATAPSLTTNWADGPTVGFSSDDYTTIDGIHFTLSPNSALPEGGKNGYSIDLTQMTKDWLNYGNNGFALEMENATWPYPDAPYFRQSENDSAYDVKDNGGQRSPELIIEYTSSVPEPASLGLLMLGGAAMLLRRKRA